MSNSNKQTSVEWLVSKLPQRMLNYLKEEIEQAKAMHKEEIMETARFYFHERGKATPEQYYKDKYGK